MRELPDRGFAGDTGAADPAVAEALARYAEAPDRRHSETLVVLQSARLLVPVLAVPRGVGYHGQVASSDRAADPGSDMATALMRGRDGRTALLAFTGTGAMAAWDRRARPVPVPAASAARAAVSDGAAALLVDVAGPVRYVVEAADLRSLAEGYTLTRLGSRLAWVRACEPLGSAWEAAAPGG